MGTCTANRKELDGGNFLAKTNGSFRENAMF